MEGTLIETINIFSLWKRAVYIAVFFLLTPTVLSVSILSLLTLSKSNEKNANEIATNLIQSPMPGVQVYASLPATLPSISGQVLGADARSELIKLYLSNYDSPLAPYASLIVKEADNYGLDYRLITAIAQQESNLCKKIPEDSYNCWGWGIHSKGTLKFSSFEEGIDGVSKGIKEEYIDKGYTKINDIMSKYTPFSDGSWAYAVNKFMDEMK